MDDAKLEKEVDVRDQRMRVSFAKYAKPILQSNLNLKLRINLFNMMVGMNGLFGCQVWNITTRQVAKLEGTFFELVRNLKLLGAPVAGFNRVEIIKYAEERELHLLPLELRMV